MEKNKKKNSSRFIVLTSLWIISTFLPPITVHSQTDIIELPAREVSLIIGTLYRKGFNQWISLAASAGDPKKEAGLAVMRRTVKTSTLSFLLVQAPKEIALDFIKIGSKVASVAFDPGLSSLSKLGTNELKKIIIEQLVKNEIRTGGGNLSSSYPDMSGNFTSAIFPYVLAYNPKTGKAEIKIYSPQTIKAPQPTLSNPWSGGIDELPPFVINVSGAMKKTSGGYLWENDPEIDIDFSETVSNFEFKELSLLEKQFSSLNKTLIAFKRAVEIVEGAEKAIAHLWEVIKNAIVSVADKGAASIYSIIGPSGGNETLVFVQKDDTLPPKDITVNKTSPEITDKNSEEVQKLLKIIADMEKKMSESSGNAKQDKQAISVKVDINTASMEDLTRIIHIGPARAKEIIRLRPFSSLDGLIRVSGIGEKIITDIKTQGIAYVSDAYETAKEDIDEEITEKNKEEQANNYCNIPININTASAEHLTCLPGIGEAIAQRIIDYRKNSFYNSLDDLLKVSGIGPATLEKIKVQGLAYAGGGIISGSSSLPSSDKDTNDKPSEVKYCLPQTININTAEKNELTLINGVGEVIAQRIIDHRKNQKFKTVDDLLSVSGIGPAILEKIKVQGCAYVAPPANEPPISNEEIEVIGAEAMHLLRVDRPDELAFYPALSPQTPEKIFISQEESHWSPIEKMILADHIEEIPEDSGHNYDKEIEIIEAESLWTSKLSPAPANPVQKPNISEIIIRAYESKWKKRLFQIITYG